MTLKTASEMYALAEAAYVTDAERIVDALSFVMEDEAREGLLSFECSYAALEQSLDLPEGSLHEDDSAVVEAGELFEDSGYTVKYIHEFSSCPRYHGEPTERRAIHISWAEPTR